MKKAAKGPILPFSCPSTFARKNWFFCLDGNENQEGFFLLIPCQSKCRFTILPLHLSSESIDENRAPQEEMFYSREKRIESYAFNEYHWDMLKLKLKSKDISNQHLMALLEP